MGAEYGTESKSLKLYDDGYDDDNDDDIRRLCMCVCVCIVCLCVCMYVCACVCLCVSSNSYPARNAQAPYFYLWPVWGLPCFFHTISFFVKNY